jgi:DNA/RNA-binding domain of Phe-tRNA-synthetase-like protein
MFRVSDTWRAAYPGAVAGILLMRNVANPARHPVLDTRIAECEAELRRSFGGGDRTALKSLPALESYAAYYGRYRKTYHVQLQLESVALKGKAMPRGPALVAAMVLTELSHLLLTAGHDLDTIRPPVTLDVASGRERYILLGGNEQELKANDMMMTDAHGVISSILYGPDSRTRITPATRHALFAVYAPPGIGEPAVVHHLEALKAAVLLVAPDAEIATSQAYPAG